MSNFFWKPLQVYLEPKGWFYVDKVFGESISNSPREHFLLLLFKKFCLSVKLLLRPSLECQCDFYRFWKPYTAQKMKFSIKDFFSKCDQIRRKLRIWSHLLKKSLMENFILCAVLMMEHRGFVFNKHCNNFFFNNSPEPLDLRNTGDA